MKCFGWSMSSKKKWIVIGPQNRRIGLVTSGYDELIDKCIEKFQLNKEDFFITLEDGTEVDDEYFEVLSEETILEIRTHTKNSIQNVVEFMKECFDKMPHMQDHVNDLLHMSRENVELKKLFHLMAEACSDSSISGNEIENDKLWFQGLDTKYRAKEAVMRSSAESRMRSYLERSKKELLPKDGQSQKENNFLKAVDYFKDTLRINKYNANYFDRSAEPTESLCDHKGMFRCDGEYNKSNCSGLHFINPYSSREARIIFSTWNFDHVIEKSRTVLPTLKTALSSPRSTNVNLKYFYDLLFLHKRNMSCDGNLKLVHIACHVKKPHQNRCSQNKIYMKNKVEASEGLKTVNNKTTKVVKSKNVKNVSKMDLSKKKDDTFDIVDGLILNNVCDINWKSRYRRCKENIVYVESGKKKGNKRRNSHEYPVSKRSKVTRNSMFIEQTSFSDSIYYKKDKIIDNR